MYFSILVSPLVEIPLDVESKAEVCPSALTFRFFDREGDLLRAGLAQTRPAPGTTAGQQEWARLFGDVHKRGFEEGRRRD